MRRLARLAAMVLALAVWACLAGNRPGDPALYPPAADNAGWRIHLADHGFHIGFVIARDDLAEVAQAEALPALIDVANRFRDYRHLEIGWGDGGFYRGPIDFDLVSGATIARALAGAGGASVLHVVGLERDPAAAFPRAAIVPIELSRQGSKNLAAHLEATFARAEGLALELGPGLYGPSLFYRAAPVYSVFNTCNHWVAAGLNRAGLGVSMFPATFSLGLRADLAWRRQIAIPRSSANWRRLPRSDGVASDRAIRASMKRAAAPASSDRTIALTGPIEAGDIDRPR